MSIFPPEILSAFSRERVRDRQAMQGKLGVLRDLLRRHADGTLAALSEQRVEQSFNERLFAEIFDFRTLFLHGEGSYHLQPKERHPSGRYDDFSLGFFRPGGGDHRVLGELKSPGADLDKSQSSYKDKVTPVQQAFRAAEGHDGVRWVLVSNFDEVRLYRADDPSCYEVVQLTDILTLRDMARAYALLGCPCLLGEEDRPRSPLDVLYDGGPPMLIPPRPGCVRLVHEATPEGPADEEPLSVLHQGLVAAFNGIGGNCSILGNADHVALEYDRLIMTEEDEVDGVCARLEFTSMGTLRMSEYAAPVSRTGPSVVEVKYVVDSIAAFLRLAAASLGPLFTQTARFEWSLLECADTILNDRDLTPRTRGLHAPTPFRTPPDRDSVRSWLPKPVVLDFSAEDRWVHLTRQVVNEFLFHFEGVISDGRTRRAEATEDFVRKALGLTVPD